MSAPRKQVAPVLVQYGYRVGDIPLPPITAVKEGTTVKTADPGYRERRVVGVSLGPHVADAVCPKPCPSDMRTALLGACKRFAHAPPKPNEQLIHDLRVFVDGWLEKNIEPILPDADTSVGAWLTKTAYPGWRRDELSDVWARNQHIDFRVRRDLWFCDSFVKDEEYEEFKHARVINARSDPMKCYFGPYFKLMEEKLYRNHHFIKHVPVAERPAFISGLLSKYMSFFASDYSSFESLFTRELMEACEFRLYSHMMKNLPQRDEFMEMIHNVLGGVNECRFRDFKMWVNASRMSGEMCTSLGNGFTNLMAMLFLCHRRGIDCDGVVEGDDGLFGIEGEAPTSEDFAALGLEIKLSRSAELSKMSFCGLIFDEVELINVTDPIAEIVTFGWGSHQYARARTSKHRALLRCKALSLAYQYPGCPVIHSLAQYALRVTRSIDIRGVLEKDRSMNMWYRETLQGALKQEARLKHIQKSPGIRTRLLVENLFGISVSDQIAIETYLDGLQHLEVIACPYLQPYMKIEWLTTFANYVGPMDRNFTVPSMGVAQVVVACLEGT